MMMVKRVVVPMSESNKEWVVGYLGSDAATNHPKLPEVNTWVLELYNDMGRDYVEVRESIDGVPIKDDGFVLEDDNLDRVVNDFRTVGFPIADFM